VHTRVCFNAGSLACMLAHYWGGLGGLLPSLAHCGCLKDGRGFRAQAGRAGGAAWGAAGERFGSAAPRLEARRGPGSPIPARNR
jgi:hypothetical protein